MRLEPYADGRLNDELTFPTNGAATVMPFTIYIDIMIIYTYNIYGHLLWPTLK